MADDLLRLTDDDHRNPAARTDAAWRVLVVDDDEDVHAATAYALADEHILGRPIELLHARSAAEARGILSRERDIAVLLLDVVMESEDAGLALVRAVREELGLAELRIILRTGQPGSAPELKAISSYDINDYRTKEELTRTRLVTSLTTAIRSYDQIHRLNFLAYNDPLTGLPNRPGLVDLVDRLREESAEPHAVILIDIDQFADINDVLGARIGDAVLIAVVERLRRRLAPGVRLGRYGGDVICAIGRPAEVSAANVARLFDEPVEVEGYTLPASVTVGECLSSVGGDALEVFKNAGLALTRAKRGVRGHALAYTEQMGAESRARLELLAGLRSAVRRSELDLYYQPKIDLANGRIVGVEALLRWTRGRRDVVMPDTIIPLAEQSGLILEIGEWVALEACRQLAEWSREGCGDLHVAINVSAQQLKRGQCAQLLRRSIEAHGLAPERIEIEVTESMMLDDIDDAIRCLNELKAVGVRVALDDFGTGFSSLSRLQQLPIDAIKIDRSFMHGIGEPGRGELIAEMVVTLAKLLKLNVIAEGVETGEQARIAMSWGCHLAQGHYYSPPLRPAELLALVKSRAAG